MSKTQQMIAQIVAYMKDNKECPIIFSREDRATIVCIGATDRVFDGFFAISQYNSIPIDEKPLNENMLENVLGELLTLGMRPSPTVGKELEFTYV